MSWRIGQRAVCVEGPEWFDARICWCHLIFRNGAGEPPQRGAVYLIEALDTCSQHDGVYLQLAGWTGQFHSLGFRPAVDAELEKLAEIAANPPALAPALEPAEAA